MVATVTAASIAWPGEMHSMAFPLRVAPPCVVALLRLSTFFGWILGCGSLASLSLCLVVLASVFVGSLMNQYFHGAVKLVSPIMLLIAVATVALLCGNCTKCCGYPCIWLASCTCILCTPWQRFLLWICTFKDAWA